MKTCIIIAGPTAIGKTALAIQVAKYFSTEIISADSRQCYKELDIGVAKPSPEELKTVHHYFINSHSIHDNLSAADFEKYALDSVSQIFEKNDIAVMAGGTGLYIKAFMQGLDDIPFIDGKIKESIIQQYKTKGLEWLQAEIEKRDPLFFAAGEIKNPHRLIRALEVKTFTGRSIMEFQLQQKKARPFNSIPICLQLPRAVIYERINRRVEEMINQGLIKEVQGLLPFKQLNALQTVGYRELFDYFEGKVSLEKAVELIKQNTRRYAKRQIAWFNKEEEIHFCPPRFDHIVQVIKDNGGIS